jgi:hypothetical protein
VGDDGDIAQIFDHDVFLKKSGKPEATSSKIKTEEKPKNMTDSAFAVGRVPAAPRAASELLLDHDGT